MSVRLVYQDIAPGAAEDAEITAKRVHEFSSPAILPFGAKNPANYVTLEPNRWVLDGSYEFYDGGAVAFWSDELSDGSGFFSEPPTIIIDFDERYTSLGIYLEFSGDAWVSDLRISWYQGETQLDSSGFQPDGMSYFCERTVKAYDRIIITLNQTSLPHRRARIDLIMFGVTRTFLRNELRSGGARIIQEIDPTSREMSANAMDFALSSKNAVEYLFQFKQPVYAYDSDVLIGVFYIDDSDRLAERIYDITCTDAIGVLDHEPFPDSYYAGVNAFSLAQSICSGFTVEMQEDLQDATVRGILKDKTRRGALQQLCFALGAVADTSGTDAIRIFTLKTDELTDIGANRTRIGGSVTTDPIVTEVRVTAHSYSTGGSTNEVEINGVKYYDTQTVTAIRNPDATPSDKANVVDIQDATLVSPDNAAAIAQHLYDHYARRNTHNLKFHLYGELPGDYVRTVTPWKTNLAGHYIKGSIKLSGFALSDAEVIGS